MSDSYFSSPLSVRCVEVIVVGCERGSGDLRESLTQVYWKDGTLLAEHDWLHDDPTYANFFLRAAAERGEWLPVKLRAKKTDAQPADAPISTGAAGPAPIFAGIDVQRDRISMAVTSHQVVPGTRLEITLTELGGREVKASHPFGHAFTGYLHTDAEVHKRISAWLAELRAEAALGRNETQDEAQDRLAGVAAAGEGQ